MRTRGLVVIPVVILESMFVTPAMGGISDEHHAPSPIDVNKRSAVYISEVDIWYPQGRVGAENITPDDPACGWRRVQTPIAGYFLDVWFVDSLNGWAGHTDNGCIRTTDGGFNWDVTTFDDTNFVTSYEGVYFVTKDTGWCVGGAIQVRKTTDGGVNWFKQHGPVGINGINRSVRFIDSKYGYVVGSKNFPYEPYAMKTIDGGSTWSELDVATPVAQELIDQYWFNADSGWLCGYNVLLQTTDGGATFSDRFANLPPTGNGHNILFAVEFESYDIGWISAGNLERHNIYKTTNGGVDWVFQDNPVSRRGWNQINDIRFISPDSGWAAHGTPGTGAIMFTTNGGTTWFIDNDRNSWYECLASYKDRKVWSGASQGSMWYRTLELTTGVSIDKGLPTGTILSQNYPNPFNSVTTISFSIPQPSFVTLSIHDLSGREVETLARNKMTAGVHRIKWNSKGNPSGVYFYRLKTEISVQVGKLVLLR